MIELRLEQLSISMAEGVVSRWLVADGEQVEKGQPVVEIETDKATVEVEAPGSGTLRILVAAGTIVPVDAVLAEVGEGSPAPVPPVAAAPAAAANRRRQIASPAARRVARELGVDLGAVAGSGPSGRILVSDIERAAPTAPPAAAADLRGLVVESITQSWRTIPHIHIGGELVADGLAQAKRSAPTGVTVTDLLVLAVAVALRDVRDLNGHVGAAGAERSDRVHLALAVATGNGVVAPVLRDASELPLAGIAAERARLVAAARAGLLEKRDLGGATCTLSNLGAYPVDFFAPVVTAPQIALVATGRLAEKPVAIDGMIAVRHRLWVNAAIDHRGADGEAGGRFLAALERRLAELPASIS